jgi:hypothetical protein
MHAPTHTESTAATEYFVAIRALGVSHYFRVESRAAAAELAKKAVWVHRGRVWVEDSQTASSRDRSLDDWQRRWETESDCSAAELAKLCCGWNPDSDVLPDHVAHHAAQERILRAVRTKQLHPSEVAVSPITRDELFYREGPIFKMRDAAPWA